MKLKICLMGILCLFFQAHSQSQTTPKYLTIGDKMPDAEILNILNWKHKASKVSDFKGKLIILDFWNTYCSGCIEGFPKLDSLQKQFKGKIQVFLVNRANAYEKERNIKIVIDRMRSWSMQPFELPFVVNDTTLSKYFNYHGVPYGVWIGPDGNIAAIPVRTDINADNISKVLAGEKLDIKQNIQKPRYVPGKVQP